MSTKIISVLVVDDELLIRMSLEEYLNDMGMDTVGVATGEEALDAVGNREFEVAIVDLHLPDMDGEDLIMQCREVLPDLRYIIQTGAFGYCPSDRLVNIGVDQSNVLTKPQRSLRSFVNMIEALAASR